MISASTMLDRVREQSNDIEIRVRAIGAGGSSSASSLVANTSSAINQAFGSTDDDRQFAHFTGWVYAAIRPIAQTIAGLPVRVAKVNRSTKPTRSSPMRSALPQCVKNVSGDLEIFEDHTLLRILHDPNPLMVYWHLINITITNLELTGKAFWWKQINKEGKVEIWPLPSNWVSPRRSNGGIFLGWTIRPDGTGEGHDVPPEEIAYFYYPNPSDPLGTRSPLGAMMKAVHSDESIQTAQAASFENGIFPGMAIIAGNIIDEDEGDQGRPLLEQEQRQEIYDAIHRHWGGVTKAGEPLILDALIKDVKAITASTREMDFPGSGKITKARIMQGFGTNEVINGELEGANRASSAVARQHFAEFTLNPKVELISQTLTKCVGPWVTGSNEELVIWIEPYRPDDREEKRKDYDLMAKHGAVSRNQIRAALQDLPPMKDGDNIAINANLVLVPVESQRATKVSTKAIARRDAILDPEATKLRWLKSQETAERSLTELLIGLFGEQRNQVVGSLQSIGATGASADLLLNLLEWNERFMEVILPELTGEMVEGALAEVARFSASQQIGVGSIDDLLIDLPPDVARAIRQEVAQIPKRPYWQDIHITTRNQLATAISDGIAEGESLHELVLRIEDTKIGVLGDEPISIRAAKIARTETTGALNAGHDFVMQDLANDGLIEKKEWSATIDGFTRDTHRAAHGQQVPVKGLFDVGGHPGRFPGDPNLPAKERIFCRCTTIAVHTALTEPPQ